MPEPAIFFDLDGTLYRSSIIAEKFAEAAYQTYARFKACPVQEAGNVVEARRDQLSCEQETKVPYTITLLSLGIPVEIWHETNIDYFDPRDYLTADVALYRCLVDLKKHYRLAVITNNNQTQCERMLEAIGIRSLFVRLFTYNTFRLLKPDPEFIRKACAALNVRASDCIMVGDRYRVDLEPAEKLGMTVYEVKGPDTICRLAKNLCGEEDK